MQKAFPKAEITGALHPYLALLPFCSVVLLYCQAGKFDFINFDDNIYLTENPSVAAGLTWQGVRWAFTTSVGGHWHPLTWLSHMLDISLFGMNPGPHHLVNVALHALNGTLLYLLLSRVLREWRVPLFASLLFALHPLRVESVAWVAERKDVLSMFFGLTTLLLYQSSARGRSKQWLLLAICSYVLALLSKPTVVVLPFLMVLIDWWSGTLRQAPLKGEILSGWRCISETRLYIFFWLALSSAVITVFAQSAGGGLRTLEEVPLLARIQMPLLGYLAYLGKLFFPLGLSIFYPAFDPAPGLATGSLIGLGAITWICWSLKTIAPWFLFGWLWFLVALLPISGFITVGGQFVADRWTYLAHIGPIVALVYGSVRRHPHWAGAALTLILVTLGYLTYSELPHWKSSESLFQHALKANPANFMAHTNLGVALAQSGRKEEALYHYEEAARLNPFYPEALNNLGTLRAEGGRIREALELFEKALVIKPSFEIARQNRNQALQDLSRTGGASSQCQ